MRHLLACVCVACFVLSQGSLGQEPARFDPGSLAPASIPPSPEAIVPEIAAELDTSDQPAPRTPAELASRVQQAMEAAGFAHLEAVLSENERELFKAESAMAADRMITKVLTLDGELVTWIRVENGLVREHLPRFRFGQGRELSNVTFSYQQYDPDGTDDTYLRTEDVDGCHFGGLLSTWVGPGTHRSSYLARMIGDSELVGRAKLDGQMCDVARFELETGATEPGALVRIEMEFWVSRQTSWVVRRDASQISIDPATGSERRIDRSERYRYRSIQTEPPRGGWLDEIQGVETQGGDHEKASTDR